jgi:heme ABC exporter ATP-binding subunit CcmA
MKGLNTDIEIAKNQVVDNERYIEVKGLKKSFGYHPVLNGVNFELRRGEYLVILGKNGCGKTTLINIIATLLQPSQGKVIINGLDTKKQAVAIRRKLGFVAHSTMLYNELTLQENLRFYGRMYSVTDLEKRITELVSLLELRKWQDRRVSDLSRGIQQRTAIARSLVHKPHVLLLDEPESGLDPTALSLLETILTEQTKQGCSIIATSHNLDFARKTSSRLAVLDKGRFAYESNNNGIDLSSLKNIFNLYSGIKHEAVF